MIVETFPVGLLQCNCTIVGDETSREAMVIDPGDDPDDDDDDDQRGGGDIPD